MKSVAVILQNGVEELEAIAPTDILRRAGARVEWISLAPTRDIAGRSGIALRAEKMREEIAPAGVEAFDMLFLPGGPAVQTLRQDARLLEWIRQAVRARIAVAAICAAPVLLKEAGVLGRARRTAHPSVAGELAPIEAQNVVSDGLFTTSRGAGTAVEFGLSLVRTLFGGEKAAQVARDICFDAAF